MRWGRFSLLTMVPIHFNLSRYIQIQINIPLSPILSDHIPFYPIISPESLDDAASLLPILKNFPALLVEGAWGGHTLHVKALLYYVLHILAGWEELMMLKIGEGWSTIYVYCYILSNSVICSSAIDYHRSSSNDQHLSLVHVSNAT